MGSLAAPIISFTTVFLVTIPLPYHLKTKNVAILCLAFWIVQWNLFQGINSVVWNGSVIRKWLVYCDITLFLKNAGIFGVIASNMCILRHLEHISSPAYLGASQANTKRRTWFEALMCIVFPLFFAGCQIIVQPNRFDIYEDFGCTPAIWVSWQNMAIWYAPPLILSVTTFTYAMATTQWLLRGRRRFQRLNLSRSGMSTAQFIRLLTLAVILSASAAWSTIFQIIVNVAQNRGLNPWVSWNYVHADFRNVHQYPKSITPPFLRMFAWVFFMLAPYAGILFFLLFGLSGEALASLRRAMGIDPTHLQNKNKNKNQAPEGVDGGRPRDNTPGGFRDSDPFHCSPIRHHFRARPRTQTLTLSARARWEAGNDLYFQDDDLGLNSGRDEHIRHDVVAGCVRSGGNQIDVPSNDPSPHPPADVQRDLATECSTDQVPSETPPSETPMSSPSLYASTEMSHSAPHSTPSDTQLDPLDYRPATSFLPAVPPSHTSTPGALETACAQQTPLSSWSLQPKAHTKKVRFLSTSTYELPREGHTRRTDRTLSYQFI